MVFTTHTYSGDATVYIDIDRNILNVFSVFKYHEDFYSDIIVHKNKDCMQPADSSL